jgi:DNA-binding MarR family transcriptional regulator
MSLISEEKKGVMLQPYHKNNIGKLINMWKRFFDDWAHDALTERGYDYFKMGYMPFIMNISEEGSTNNEIACKARVTKQAMSKVVKELVGLGLIKSVKHQEDARASLLFLTPKGKKFLTEIKSCMVTLSEEYRQIIGSENFEIMTEGMFKIIEFHESKSQNKTLRIL